MRGGQRPPRILTAVAAIVLSLLAVPVAARADGDPASDYLLTDNVYLPIRAPSASLSAALRRAANDVYAHGNRVKVALIYDARDLGAIPSLYGRADDYAHFLGVELEYWYVGPLLVVMPAGLALYDGGRPTAASEPLLRSVPVSEATSPDALVRSAIAALRRLEGAGALSSPDVKAPLVTVHPVTATRGRSATLRFDLFDDSGRAAALVRVQDGSSVLAVLASPQRFAVGTRRASVRWLVPRRLRSRQLRYCVVASDPTGNRSAPACAPFLRIR
jgi:hypothetical protein